MIMRTFLKHNVGFLCWLLVLANIIFIFALTLQDAKSTMQLSNSARDTVVEVSNISVNVAQQSWWYQNIRKLGHIPEYFALGVTVSLALQVTSRRRAYLKALALCAFVSISDQLLKGFLPTREFDVTDLPFDFVGYLVGIGLMMSMFWVIKKKQIDF